MHHSLSPLEAAKARLSIPQLWHLLGLPGRPARSCRSPFRPERHASFSIHDECRRFYDFSTGDHGDAADFVARVFGLSPEDGLRRFLELAGQATPCNEPNERTSLGEFVRSGGCATPDRAEKRRRWPRFESPTRAELSTIAAQRGLSIEATALAAERGLLYCAESREGRAWIITDTSRRNAQARRMDGLLWVRISAKAWTLPGSEAARPIGLPEAKNCASLVLVEGGPDLLAALHLASIEDRAPAIAPVAMLGASHQIPADCLPAFCGKHVRLFPHADPAGAAAARRWAAQLHAAGAGCDYFSFSSLTRHDGAPVKDLNDFAHLHPDTWEREPSAATGLFTFPNPTPNP